MAGERRKVQGLIWFLATLPVLAFLTLFSFALRARWSLGRWPSYSNPDPKDLGFDFHYWLSGLTLNVSVLAQVLLTVLAIVSWAGWLRAYRWSAFLAALVCTATLCLLIGVLWLDPVGLMEWYVD